MKKNIHPQYHNNVVVTCSCGNTFTTGSTIESITTELCSQCHPFYTGEHKIVDTENLVARYEERAKKATDSYRNKKAKMAERKQRLEKLQTPKTASSGLTLKDMLAGITKK